LPLASNPSEKARITTTLAENYVHLNDYDKAEKLLVDALNATTDKPQDQFVQQSAFRQLMQIWQAKPAGADAYITNADAALQKDPNNVALLERLSDVYGQVKHDPSKAIQCIEKLAALRPDDKGAQYRLAAQYQQAKVFDKAIDVYKKLMTVTGASKPEQRTQAFQIGMLTLQSGKKDEAVAWIKDNYAKDATAARDYITLAMFYEQAGMSAETEAALAKSAELASTPEEKADARMRLPEYLLRKKDYAKAAEMVRAVLNDYKDSGNPAVMRANYVLKRVNEEKSKAAAAKPIGLEDTKAKAADEIKPTGEPQAGQK
jgi:tetratricopeptide (TPR) repeat protein